MMPQLPLVSVCILSKNPGNVFKEVLQAVVKQHVDFDYEVIIIDSGSTDGTLQYIENLNDDRVKVFSIPPKEFGHGKTRNYAISQSLGEYIVMITHDAKPRDETWLQNMINPFFLDENIAGVFGRHIAYESATIFTKRDLNMHFDNFKNAEMIVSLEDNERYKVDPGYRQVLHYFSDNNAALRKSVWHKHPYPEVDFAEDQLWAKEIIEQGYKKAYADEGVVYHSHNYDLKQTFQRSYDESRALKRLFNYNVCPSFLNVFYQTLACSRRDIKYYHDVNNNNSLAASANIISGHFLKQFGYYLGNNFPKNKTIFRLVSLDNSIKRN